MTTASDPRRRSVGLEAQLFRGALLPTRIAPIRSRAIPILACLGRREQPGLKEHFADLHAVGVVDIQYFNGGSADGRLGNQEQSLPAKMTGPPMPTGMEKAHGHHRGPQEVNTGYIRSFIKITAQSRPGELTRDGLAVVLSRDDMVHLERGSALFVREVAVFTEPPGPRPHLLMTMLEEAVRELQEAMSARKPAPDWLDRVIGSMRHESAFDEVLALCRAIRQADRAAEFLLDTDHISVLQKQSGREYPPLLARIAGFFHF